MNGIVSWIGERGFSSWDFVTRESPLPHTDPPWLSSFSLMLSDALTGEWVNKPNRGKYDFHCKRAKEKKAIHGFSVDSHAQLECTRERKRKNSENESKNELDPHCIRAIWEQWMELVGWRNRITKPVTAQNEVQDSSNTHTQTHTSRCFRLPQQKKKHYGSRLKFFWGSRFAIKPCSSLLASRKTGYYD